jgi:EpsI family protein
MKWRALTILALLGATAVLLRARNSAEIIPAHQPLRSFPRTFEGWASQDLPLGKDVLEVLGPGDFLTRNYQHGAAEPWVSLFIAYFPSQRSGDTIHSPKNCLPGAGWVPLRSDRITLTLSAQAPFEVNRYLIARGQDRQLVLYWYWAHDRAVASEYWAKYFLVTDSIRLRRSDGSLIRLTTPLLPRESIDSAQQRMVGLANNIVALINDYVPR